MKNIGSLLLFLFFISIQYGCGGDKSSSPVSSLHIDAEVRLTSAVKFEIEQNATLETAQNVSQYDILMGDVRALENSPSLYWPDEDIKDVYRVVLGNDRVVQFIPRRSDQVDSVALHLFDAAGELLVSIVEGRVKEVGPLSSGVYYVGIEPKTSEIVEYVLHFPPSNHSFVDTVPGEIVYAQKAGAQKSVRRAHLVPRRLVVPDPVGSSQKSSASTSADLVVSRGFLTEHHRRLLSCEPDVVFAERGVQVKPQAEFNDPDWSYQLPLRLANIDKAWDLTRGLEGQVVAVIDTGQINHQDIDGNLVDGFDFVASPTYSCDGDGIDPDPFDSCAPEGYSHGTLVSGVIGATQNNGKNISGITQSKIMPLRVMHANGGSFYDVAQALYYAAGLQNDSGEIPSRPADIINMSLGSDGYASVMAEAVATVRRAGNIMVAAAGNGGRMGDFYPAALDGVFAVGAVRMDGSLTDYTNYGDFIDVVASSGDNDEDNNGDGIPDAVPTLVAEDETFFADGTSLSSPIVAGVFSLMNSMYSSVSPLGRLTEGDIHGLLSGLHPHTGYRATKGDSGVKNPFTGYGEIDALGGVQGALRLASVDSIASPVLSLSASNLDFSTHYQAFTIDVTDENNAEIGGLYAFSPAPWLSAEVITGPIDRVKVVVDRSRLNDGLNSDRLYISSYGAEELAVDVSALNDVGIRRDLGDLLYVVINSNTGSTIEYGTLVYDGGYELGLDVKDDRLRSVVVGTDVDKNGVVCEIGDLCYVASLGSQDLLDGTISGPYILSPVTY